MIIQQNLNSYSPTYTAKCPQLKDSEWVCNKITQTLPHFSVTKHQPVMKNIARKFFGWCDERNNFIDLEDIYVALIDVRASKEEIKQFGFRKKLVRKVIQSLLPKEMNDNFRQIGIIKDVLGSFGKKRELCYKSFGLNNNTFAALYLMEKFKLANCYENAIVAKLILRMNGIKNAEVIALKNIYDQAVHTVCIFNRDGSKFKNIENNNSIIIDPWLGKADFANNMFRVYKNQYAAQFMLPDKGQMTFKIHKTTGISRRQMKLLKTKYHQFIFKNSQRHFMQTDKSQR